MEPLRYSITLDAADALNKQKLLGDGFQNIKAKAEENSKVNFDGLNANIDKLISSLDKLGMKLDEQGTKIKKISESSGGFAEFGENVKKFIEDPMGSAGQMAGDLISKLGPVGVGITTVAGT